MLSVPHQIICPNIFDTARTAIGQYLRALGNAEVRKFSKVPIVDGSFQSGVEVSHQLAIRDTHDRRAHVAVRVLAGLAQAEHGGIA